MTTQIQQRIKKRRALFRAGKRAEYKALSEKIERAIHKRKFKYIRRRFSAKNPSYWRFVNDFRELNQAASESILATALNEGFVSVWSGLVQPDLSAYTTANCPPPQRTSRRTFRHSSQQLKSAQECASSTLARPAPTGSVPSSSSRHGTSYAILSRICSMPGCPLDLSRLSGAQHQSRQSPKLTIRLIGVTIAPSR